MNKESKGPSRSGRPRSFYDVHDNGDGTADIYFDTGTAFPMTDNPEDKADVLCRVMKGVELYEGIEEDIRRNYDKWYQSAEVICL